MRSAGFEAGDTGGQDSLNTLGAGSRLAAFLFGGDELFEKQRVAFRGPNDPGRLSWPHLASR